MPNQEYISRICCLYGDHYDDREEDSWIKGLNWGPGVKAGHKSISAFQRELEKYHGIHLSRTKIQKTIDYRKLLDDRTEPEVPVTV